MFCPKCKCLLLPKTEGTKKTLNCSCGYRSEGDLKMTEAKKPQVKQEFHVVEEKVHLPLTDAECSKCHHMKAYYWIHQTRSADEPPTRFFRCEKCKHTWREYK